jgi:hypothetical protein
VITGVFPNGPCTNRTRGYRGTLQDSPPAYLPFLEKFPMACGDHPLSPSAIFTFTFNLHLCYSAMNLNGNECS